MKLFRLYRRIPLLWRILIAFVLGIAAGLIVSLQPKEISEVVLQIATPFGDLLIALLKMVVFPLIFFSLINGTAQMPLRKSGRIGASVAGWYFLTSLGATIFGVVLALALDPRMRGAAGAAAQPAQFSGMKQQPLAETISKFIGGLFQNPFQALANNSFLAVIVYAILFGLALRVLLDADGPEEGASPRTRAVELIMQLCQGASDASLKMIEWMMEYFPIGVFALTLANFARHGALLFGPYMQIVFCVVAAVLLMLLVFYPVAIFASCRINPYPLMWKLRQPIITAFATRSSAATLPVSLKTASELGVSPSLSNFSLPLGCTVNMDGVCVHLPVFVILAGNLFGIQFTFGQLLLLVVSVVFASVGTGGIPGGSIFLLFMVLETMRLTPEQVGVVVALALGINPILDMFETACNVAGDNVCTYIVARLNGMLGKEE